MLQLGFIFLFSLAGFYLLRVYRPRIQAVYPNQCSFLLDEQMSLNFSQTLQRSFESLYLDLKDPYLVVEKVSEQFPELVSIDASICQTDKLCFSCDIAKPLFSLNNSLLVCENLKIFNKEHYCKDMTSKLHHLVSADNVSVDKLIPFFQKLPTTVFDEYIVSWIDDYKIVLQQKGQADTLLFSVSNYPNENDINAFKRIKSNLQHEKSRKQRVYDFRFNNQVIVS